MPDSGATTAGLRFSVLGPLEATYDGTPLSLGGRQQRAVLAALLCEAGRAVPTARLVDEIWPEPVPPGAVTTLQTYVFHLRQVLEPDRPRGAPARVLQTVRDGYRLAVGREMVDLGRFEDGVAVADAALRGERPEAALAAYDEALGLWRGPVLGDLADHAFVAPVRYRLEEMRLSAVESRIEAELALGRHQVVATETGVLVREHPLREGFHAQRVLALYRCGRQSDALSAYRELHALLDDELGVAPSPALQELQTRVLRQDPDLDLPRPVRRLSAAAERPRRRWLAAAAVALVALTGGAAVPLAHPRPAQASVPANSVSVLDGSGTVLASVAVGTSPTALAASGDSLWVVNAGDGTVSQVDVAERVVRRVVPVGQDPRAVAVTGGDVWVANFADGTVSHLDAGSGRVVGTVDVGSGPAALAAGRAGLWVANSGDNTIQRIDPATGRAGDPVDVDDGPDGLAVDDRSVWVAHGRAGSVWHIDAATSEPMAPPIRVGSGPRGLALIGTDVWVADELSQSVTRIDATGRPHTVEVNDGPTAVAAYDGAVWVAERYAGDLVRIDAVTGATRRHDLQAPVQALTVAAGQLWVATGGGVATGHRGGTLRVAAVDLPGHLTGIDPARVYDVTVHSALRVVYDTLVAYHYSSADAQVLVPDLATAVPTPTDGGRTYTFNLRPGIRYSTGAEVRARDVALGVRRALMPSAVRPDLFADIVGGRACTEDRSHCDLGRGVDVDDASGRVTFHLVEPDPLFLYALTWLVVPTPPGTPMHELHRPLPGTGPYRVSAYRLDERFELARNPYFEEWSAPAQPEGLVDRMTWLRSSDLAAAARTVREDRADLTQLTPIGGVGPASGDLVEAQLPAASQLLHRGVPQGTYFAVLNSSLPPFDHRSVRRALNFAVDRRRLVELLGGPTVALPTCQLQPPTMPSYRAYCPYVRADGGPDLPRARRLVRRSGTAHARVTVADLADGAPALERYYAQVLRSLGYRVRVVVLPADEWRRYYDPSSGFQVQSAGWLADYPFPATFYDVVACPGPGAPANYCDHGLDRRAAHANAALPTDPGGALRAWTAIDHELTDAAPLVPEVNAVDWWLTSTRVGDYQPSSQDLGPLLSLLWVR